MYFEVKVKSDRIQENGSVKRVTDLYLVSALSFTEAEAKATDVASTGTTGELSITAIKRSNIVEVFPFDNVDKFYVVKCAFITIDERSAKEKRSYSHILVAANGTDNALQVFEEGMKDTMADYEVASVTESPIIEVVPA